MNLCSICVLENKNPSIISRIVSVYLELCILIIRALDRLNFNSNIIRFIC